MTDETYAAALAREEAIWERQVAHHKARFQPLVDRLVDEELIALWEVVRTSVNDRAERIKVARSINATLRTLDDALNRDDGTYKP